MSDDSHRRLHRYFVIRQSGTPSTSIDLDFASATRRDPNEPPAWLICHCEVGDAIASLPKLEREAVEARWEMVIHLEECERAVRLAANSENLCRRQRTDGAKWRLVIKDAAREMEAGRRELGRLENARYSRGMDKLRIVLDDGC